jgi:hypothetical protein
LRKATISFIMSVCPHGRTRLPLDGFSWNLIFEYFWKNCQDNSSFVKNGTRVTGTLHEDHCTFLIISHSVLLTMRNVADRSCWGNQNTHFVFSNFLSPPPNKKRAIYEIMVEEYCRVGQATDGAMVHVLYILDNYCYPHTPFTICNITAFPLQQRFQEHGSVLYVHCLSCSLCELWVSHYDHDEYSYTGCDALCCGGTFLQNCGNFYQTTHCHILEHVNH